MFYLLEDNRLFNDKIIDVYVNDFQGSLWLHNNGKYKGDVIGKIKKQSENVFDLIENGDLLKIKQPKESEEKYTFSEYKEPETTNYASYIKEAFPNKILAIYKPNSKGDYIKVWEKKDKEVK